MAKANMNLPDGTKVVIKGTVEEIQKIMNTRYQPVAAIFSDSKKHPGRKVSGKRSETKSHSENNDSLAPKDLGKIVTAIKNDDNYESIEKNILDKRSQVDRVLLPLYAIQKHFSNAHELSSGEVSKILKNLGIQITQPNVAITFSRGASKFILGNKLRKKGSKVHYRISRSGEKYLARIIEGKE